MGFFYSDHEGLSNLDEVSLVSFKIVLSPIFLYCKSIDSHILGIKLPFFHRSISVAIVCHLVFLPSVFLTAQFPREESVFTLVLNVFLLLDISFLRCTSLSVFFSVPILFCISDAAQLYGVLFRYQDIWVSVSKTFFHVNPGR